MSGLSVRVCAALRDAELEVELEVAPGERLAVVGRSGAGKTTLLRSIAGLVPATRGRIALDGEAWLDSERGVAVPCERRRCGFVFQDYALFPHLSAWRNVAFALRGRRAERRRRALDLLDRFGAAELADAAPAELSGGERQRVALARALAGDPRALLLDEPLAALDASTRARSLRELDRALRDCPVPALLVTHAFEEAAMLATSVAVVEEGGIVQRGSPGQVSARPRSRFVADLTGAAVLEGSAEPEADGLTLIRLDGGGKLRSAEHGRGRVAVAVHPWEISLERPDAVPADSALNRLAGTVESVTPVGNSVRVGLAVPQPLAAEVTGRSAEALGLAPGARAVAVWKATATRLIAS